MDIISVPINLKHNPKRPQLSFYAIFQIFGYSRGSHNSHGYTYPQYPDSLNSLWDLSSYLKPSGVQYSIYEKLGIIELTILILEDIKKYLPSSGEFIQEALEKSLRHFQKIYREQLQGHEFTIKKIPGITWKFGPIIGNTNPIIERIGDIPDEWSISTPAVLDLIAKGEFILTSLNPPKEQQKDYDDCKNHKNHEVSKNPDFPRWISMNNLIWFTHALGAF